MARDFWDAHRVIFIDNPEKGRTITGAYVTRSEKRDLRGKNRFSDYD